MDMTHSDDPAMGTLPPQVRDDLTALAQERAPAETEAIRRAGTLAFAHAAGDSWQRGFAVAHILRELRADHESICAALLVDAPRHGLDGDRIAAECGAAVARLVDGVVRMEAVQEHPVQPDAGRRERVQAESLRKMLLAMAEDVRVVLIKLADCLHGMRMLKDLPEERRVPIAHETLEVFAPLANRLGIWQLKWELEDLALRWLQPEVYRQIAERLAAKRADRERFVAAVIEKLQAAFRAASIDAELTGRSKHIYSIWRKMQRKHVEFERIFDMHAVRVLVDSVPQCYAALGIVHTLWSPITGEFDDYIATPKRNNYQSIHTAVIGPEGRAVEVQIRTREMHERSELGVAAHWRYKEEGRSDPGMERKILWLRHLLEWKDEVADAREFVDRFRSEVFEDRVYVFTPRGTIVDLPAGATPIDFAYAIHSEVGDHCRGARVNGRMVPLTYTLKTGEQVDIVTVKKGGPSRDWLNPHLGYLKTSRARSRVMRWFKQQDAEQNVAAGRQAVERDLQRLGLGEVNFDRLARKLGYTGMDDMFAAVGRGDLKTTQVAHAVQEAAAPEPEPAVPAITKRPRPGADAARGVQVFGVGDLLTQVARCCSPLPGDAIVGYITRGRGVTIHRRDCPNVMRYTGDARERLVEVEWGNAGKSAYPVEIEVTAFDRQGLLKDVSSVLSDAGVNVIGANTRTDRSTHIARMQLSVEVTGIDQLSRVLNQLAQLPNVSDARRVVQ